MRADGGFQVSGSTVWHAGNDGSGSGLDADLLDGNHASYFINTSNIGSQSVSYASSAGSATNSTNTYRAFIEDTRAAERTPSDYDDYKVSWEFTNQIPGLNYSGTSWWSAMTMQGWHNGYSAWQIIGSASSAIDDFYLRAGNNTTWNTARRIWHSGDFTSTNVSNWNTAFGWGNHASAGYLTSVTAHTQAWSTITSTPTTISGYGITNAYTDTQIQNFFNGANAISGYNKSNWDTSYGWGNHASAGYATTSYVTTQINNLIAGAPGALDTLDELAAALGDDANFATTVTNSIAGKVSKSGDTMTGALTLNAGLNAYASPIYVNEIRFRDTAGSPASDPYSMRWISEASARGAGSSWLEFQLNDDSTEEIRIYGNSCAGYGCGSVSENLYHVFRADGYAWHAGNLVVVGTISASGYNSGNWDTAYGWGNHASAGYALNSALANYLPLSGGSIGGALTVNGNLTVNGTITENSSIKLKENVETSEGNLEKVVNLRPVTYNKIGSQTTELGLIAEEVAEVYPEFVQYDENGDPIGVHYSRLTAALIGAVKELTNQVQELNKKING
jgi:hypothetical protein